MVFSINIVRIVHIVNIVLEIGRCSYQNPIQYMRSICRNWPIFESI